MHIGVQVYLTSWCLNVCEVFTTWWNKCNTKIETEDILCKFLCFPYLTLSCMIIQWRIMSKNKFDKPLLCMFIRNEISELICKFWVTTLMMLVCLFNDFGVDVRISSLTFMLTRRFDYSNFVHKFNSKFNRNWVILDNFGGWVFVFWVDNIVYQTQLEYFQCPEVLELYHDPNKIMVILVQSAPQSWPAYSENRIYLPFCLPQWPILSCYCWWNCYISSVHQGWATRGPLNIFMRPTKHF